MNTNSKLSVHEGFVRWSASDCAKEQCIAFIVKHGGGSVMIWGWFGGIVGGNTIKIGGTLKKKQHRKKFDFKHYHAGM